jgi:hypothetical protein
MEVRAAQSDTADAREGPPRRLNPLPKEYVAFREGLIKLCVRYWGQGWFEAI